VLRHAGGPFLAPGLEWVGNGHDPHPLQGQEVPLQQLPAASVANADEAQPHIVLDRRAGRSGHRSPRDENARCEGQSGT